MSGLNGKSKIRAKALLEVDSKFQGVMPLLCAYCAVTLGVPGENERMFINDCISISKYPE